MFKRIVRLFLAAILLMQLPSARILMAANTDSVSLTVLPSYNLSVDIEMSTYDFGMIDLGMTTWNVSPIIVKNDGNISANYSKKLQSDGWTLETSTSSGLTHNKFRMAAEMQDAAPSAKTDWNLDNSSVSITAENTYSNLRGGENNDTFSVTASTANLWIRLEMPPTVGGADAIRQQSMTFTIEASPAYR